MHSSVLGIMLTYLHDHNVMLCVRDAVSLSPKIFGFYNLQLTGTSLLMLESFLMEKAHK